MSLRYRPTPAIALIGGATSWWRRLSVSEPAPSGVSCFSQSHYRGKELLRLAVEKTVGRERLDGRHGTCVLGQGWTDDRDFGQPVPEEICRLRQDLVGLRELGRRVVE